MPGPTNETTPDAEPIEQTATGDLEYEIVPPPPEAVPEMIGGKSDMRYEFEDEMPSIVKYLVFGLDRAAAATFGTMHSTLLEPSVNPHVPDASPSMQLVPAFSSAAAPTTGATHVDPVGEDTQPLGNPTRVQ